jgi:hypothetical protein
VFNQIAAGAAALVSHTQQLDDIVSKLGVNRKTLIEARCFVFPFFL